MAALARARPADTYRNRYRALVFLCLSLVTLSIDGTIVTIGLPSIQRTLAASNSQLQWISASYTIVFACLLVPAGAVADRHGRYRTLTLGLIWFAAGSAFAAVAASPGQLIAARVVMGIGAAAIMPTTMSIITGIFREPRERERAIAIWAAVIGVGLGLGPVLGGVLVTLFGWHSIFLVNLPVIAAALVGGYRYIPESRVRAGRRPDPLGYVLCAVGLIALMLVVIELPNAESTALLVSAGAVVAAVALPGLVWWERRHPDPMLDFRLFRNRRFAAANVAMTLVFFALGGVLFLLTQYIQSILRIPPLQAGLLTVPLTLMLIVGAPLSSILDRRFGAKITVGAAFVLVTLGFGLLGTLGPTEEIGKLIAIVAICGLGMGLAMTPTTNAIQGSLPRRQAGAGSGMNDMTRQVGAALGIAVLGTIMNAIFMGRIAPALTSSGPPAAQVPAADVAAMHQSVAAAVDAADQFPALAGAVADAFVAGQRAALAVAALASFVGLIVTVRYLPAWATPIKETDPD